MPRLAKASLVCSIKHGSRCMKKISLEYKINEPVTVDQFIELMASSTLGARRPVDDRECI